MTQSDNNKVIREKIMHVLSIYPVLSPSMLQVGIGNALPASIWKPVMEDMIHEGALHREDVVASTPSGRLQNYTQLSINGKA